MQTDEKEAILIDTEFTLYVLSQDIRGDAKSALPGLRKKLEEFSLMDPKQREEMVEHVDSALQILRATGDTGEAAWHLWKIHRAVTGRVW